MDFLILIVVVIVIVIVIEMNHDYAHDHEFENPTQLRRSMLDVRCSMPKATMKAWFNVRRPSLPCFHGLF